MKTLFFFSCVLNESLDLKPGVRGGVSQVVAGTRYGRGRERYGVPGCVRLSGWSVSSSVKSVLVGGTRLTELPTSGNGL